jgi:hypothetical protein
LWKRIREGKEDICRSAIFAPYHFSLTAAAEGLAPID